MPVSEPSLGAGTARPPIYRLHQLRTVAVVGVLIAALALRIDSAFSYGLLNSWMIFAIIGLGFYLVFGVSGQFAFSQGAFFGLGAYASAWGADGRSFLWGFVAALVLGAIVALVFSALVFRSSLFYFAIATLAFNYILLIVFREFDAFSGAGGEVVGIAKPDLLGRVFDTDGEIAALLVGLLVAALALVALIERSPLKREALALHAQPTVAATLGVPTGRLRLLMFVLGSCFAAAAGSMQAHRNGYLSTEGFSVSLSIDIFLLLLLGGMHSMWGPLLGAAFVVWAPEQLRFIGNWRGLVYGVLLVLVMVAFPKGLIGILDAVRSRTGTLFRRNQGSTDAAR